MRVSPVKVRVCKCGASSDKAAFSDKRNICMECFRDYRRDYINNRNRNNKVKAIIEKGSCCAKCEIEYDGTNACIFDFHHIGEKEKGPSELINGATWEAVMKELDKCLLLCSNCHRKEHSEEF